MSVKYACIGCGGIAMGYHLPAAKMLENEGVLKIVGVCDVIEEKAKEVAKKFGGTPYKSMNEMLKKESIDLVDILAHHRPELGGHRDPAVAAMNAGCDVVVEKPMAATIEECEDMIATAKKTGRLLGVNQMDRFNSPWMVLGKIIKEGRLGETRTITASFSIHVDNHGLDMMRFFGGEVEEVAAMTETDKKEMVFRTTGGQVATSSIRSWSAALRFANHGLGAVTVTMYPSDMTFEVVGTACRADIIGRQGELTLNEDRNIIKPTLPQSNTHNIAFYRALKAEAEAVREHKPMPITGEDGFKTVRLQLAITASISKGGKPLNPSTANLDKFAIGSIRVPGTYDKFS